MTRSLSALLAGAALSIAVAGVPAASAKPDSESGVSGRFGIVMAGRNNLGPLGEQYRLGLLFGLHAGLDFSIEDSNWSVGLGWAALVRGYYFASDQSLVNQTVEVTEVDFGLRIRRRVSLKPRFLAFSAGGVFTTNNVPIAPAEERRYVGYYGGVGYEFRAFGNWYLGVESRYSKYPDGPENVSVLLGLTTGLPE